MNVTKERKHAYAKKHAQNAYNRIKWTLDFRSTIQVMRCGEDVLKAERETKLRIAKSFLQFAYSFGLLDDCSNWRAVENSVKIFRMWLDDVDIEEIIEE